MPFINLVANVRFLFFQGRELWSHCDAKRLSGALYQGPQHPLPLIQVVTSKFLTLINYGGWMQHFDSLVPIHFKQSRSFVGVDVVLFVVDVNLNVMLLMR